MRGMFCAAAATSVCVCGAMAQSVVLNPSKIQATLKNGSTVVSIPVENSTDRAIHGSLSLDWLLPGDRVSNSAAQDVLLPPGKSNLEAPLALKDASIWLRLRYSLTPDRADPKAFTPQSGIVAISQIAPYAFEVKEAHTGWAQRGAPLTIHAQAIQPATRAPVEGAQWSATLRLADAELRPVRVSPSDAGFIDFVFNVPPSPAGKTADEDESDGSKGTLDLTARLGDFEREEAFEVQFHSYFSAEIQTDKPIYQPGQTIHFRALILDPAGKAAEGCQVALEIEDADHETAHRTQLTASRFGIVADDWTLPGNADPGEYRLLLRRGAAYRVASHAVRVSRYELPEFNVTARPDKGAYLPGQEVVVAVRGAYLFGRPVPNGKVKVVRSRQGLWNSHKRAFETDDETAAEGEADSQGLFTGHLDVTKDFAEFGERWKKRYEDLDYAAYYTDPSSGRTEQKKFAVRITHEPIHVYVVAPAETGPLPVPVYVSTFYADGRPAQTSLEISVQGTATRTTARTNRYGVAKARVLLSGEDNPTIQVLASDGSGAIGTGASQVFRAGDPRMRLETDRTVYRAGEAVTLRLRSPEMTGAVMVNAVVNDRSVATRVVRLTDGAAEATFPFQAEFRRRVVFIAWNGEESEGPTQYSLLGARGVIFPDDSGLRVNVAADKLVYRPGDPASLRITVSDAAGKPLESALGVAVVDQSVTERARTDAEFGERRWFACAFCGGPDDASIGDVKLSDLYALKKPPSPELDLVGEMLMAQASAYLPVEDGENLRAEQTTVFGDLFNPQMARIRAALDNRYLQTFDYPRDQPTLGAWLGNLWYGLHDPWGMPYSARFRVTRNLDVMEIVSSGPDKQEGTADDFVVETFSRPYFLPMERVIRGILAPLEDYPLTNREFRSLLAENGVNLDTLRDPWGSPYRAMVQTFGSSRRIQIQSSGPDGAFGTQDDFAVAWFQGRYFRRETAAVSRALAAAPSPPRNEDEFREAMEHAGIDISAYRDAWNRPYKLNIAVRDVYADRLTLTSVHIYGGPGTTRTDVTPVTRTVLTFSLRSAGPDGIEGTFDDFDIADFQVVLREQSPEPEGPKSVPGASAGGAGTIAGTVLDPAGAVVPDAMIECRKDTGKAPYETQSDERGSYRCAHLPAGSYTVQAQSRGFRLFEIREVPAADGKVTAVDITLEVGSTSESVTVAAEAPSLQTEAGELAATAAGATLAISTPGIIFRKPSCGRPNS